MSARFSLAKEKANAWRWVRVARRAARLEGGSLSRPWVSRLTILSVSNDTGCGWREVG